MVKNQCRTGTFLKTNGADYAETLSLSFISFVESLPLDAIRSYFTLRGPLPREFLTFPDILEKV